jgi:hypothetical protein
MYVITPEEASVTCIELIEAFSAVYEPDKSIDSITEEIVESFGTSLENHVPFSASEKETEKCFSSSVVSFEKTEASDSAMLENIGLPEASITVLAPEAFC